MNKILKYVILDIVRNKIVLSYIAFLFIITFGVFNLEDNQSKGLLSTLNLVLFIVPLVSIIFSTVYIYNSSEFIELLLSQPLKRKTIWLSLFYGLSISLIIAFVIGTGIPILIFFPDFTGIMMIIVGVFLSLIFVSISLLAAVYTRDKAKGIGIAILLWLYFALVFDGIILFLTFQLADYPIEKLIMAISSLNPIDLSRIAVLLRLDDSALMGYTGAVFKEFLGSVTGIVISATILILWFLVPLYFSLRKFKNKDL
ncbi:MAG: ABC transporter permease subunit [Bacteroidetes bacterium]|nr:ABC transporter permease subunit [Bacteroidota bacterium]